MEPSCRDHYQILRPIDVITNPQNVITKKRKWGRNNLEQFLLDTARDAILTTLKISVPVLLIGLIVGLIVSIFQATTQIQEQSLHFVPKILAMFIALVLLGSWMMTVMKEFTLRMYDGMLRFIGM